MIILPVIPFFFAQTYVTRIFLLAFVSCLIWTIVRRLYNG